MNTATTTPLTMLMLSVLGCVLLDHMCSKYSQWSMMALCVYCQLSCETINNSYKYILVSGGIDKYSSTYGISEKFPCFACTCFRQFRHTVLPPSTVFPLFPPRDRNSPIQHFSYRSCLLVCHNYPITIEILQIASV